MKFILKENSWRKWVADPGNWTQKKARRLKTKLHATVTNNAHGFYLIVQNFKNNKIKRIVLQANFSACAKTSTANIK